MFNKNIVGKLLVFAVLVVGLFVLRGASSLAQTTEPQFLITWQAKSYAPPQYGGKVLPTAGSPIAASLEIVSRGKLVDLSEQTIYWYLNDNFLRGGRGVQTVDFNASGNAPDVLELRVQLPNYRGDLLIKSIEIPVAAPEVVIEAPYPEANFQNTPVRVRGVPYFFNVLTPLALNFGWSVNGETPPNSENPSNLTVNLNQGAPSGSNLNIGLTIQNPGNIFESASKNIDLVFTR